MKCQKFAQGRVRHCDDRRWRRGQRDRRRCGLSRTDVVDSPKLEGLAGSVRELRHRVRVGLWAAAWQIRPSAVPWRFTGTKAYLVAHDGRVVCPRPRQHCGFVARLGAQVGWGRRLCAGGKASERRAEAAASNQETRAPASRSVDFADLVFHPNSLRSAAYGGADEVKPSFKLGQAALR